MSLDNPVEDGVPDLVPDVGLGRGPAVHRRDEELEPRKKPVNSLTYDHSNEND